MAGVPTPQRNNPTQKTKGLPLPCGKSWSATKLSPWASCSALCPVSPLILSPLYAQSPHICPGAVRRPKPHRCSEREHVIQRIRLVKRLTVKRSPRGLQEYRSSSFSRRAAPGRAEAQGARKALKSWKRSPLSCQAAFQISLERARGLEEQAAYWGQKNFPEGAAHP